MNRDARRPNGLGRYRSYDPPPPDFDPLKAPEESLLRRGLPQPQVSLAGDRFPPVVSGNDDCCVLHDRYGDREAGSPLQNLQWRPVGEPSPYIDRRHDVVRRAWPRRRNQPRDRQRTRVRL